MPKPKPGKTPPATPYPKLSNVQSKEKRWTFSFRFWKEAENFGCDKSKPKWFISLLERFRDLSTYSLDEFRADGKLKSGFRFHAIDWQHKNVPISRVDCNWVPAVYLDNEDEYPFVQFQLSKGLGRVTGFFDEEDVFNIVLLDPLHNLQPSDFSDYRIRPCNPLGCQYSELLVEVDEIRNGLKCDELNCKSRIESARLSVGAHTHAILIPMQENDKQTLYQLLSQGRIKSISDVFQDLLLRFISN